VLLPRGPDASRSCEGHAGGPPDWYRATERKQDSILFSTRWLASSLRSGCVDQWLSSRYVLSLAASRVFPVFLIDSTDPRPQLYQEPYRNFNALTATQLAFCSCAEDFDEPHGIRGLRKYNLCQQQRDYQGACRGEFAFQWHRRILLNNARNNSRRSVRDSLFY
jgi:hypothetical protein